MARRCKKQPQEIETKAFEQPLPLLWSSEHPYCPPAEPSRMVFASADSTQGCESWKGCGSSKGCRSAKGCGSTNCSCRRRLLVSCWKGRVFLWHWQLRSMHQMHMCRCWRSSFESNTGGVGHCRGLKPFISCCFQFWAVHKLQSDGGWNLCLAHIEEERLKARMAELEAQLEAQKGHMMRYVCHKKFWKVFEYTYAPLQIVWHGDARSSHKKSKRKLLNSLCLCYDLRSTLTARQQSPAEWCLLLQIQRKAAQAEKAAEAAKAAEVQRAAEAQIAAAAGGCLSLVGTGRVFLWHW